MEFITFMLNLAWSLLKISIAFGAFWLIFGRGRKVLRTLFDTMADGIQVLCIKTRKLLVKSMEKEQAEESDAGEEAEFTVEASIK